MSRDPLPIDPILPQLVEALRRQPCAVLRAPTGAGKTTRVPPALLDSGVVPGRILMLEPRRLAARAAARRIAFERSGRVGDEIGYQVRFDRQWGRQTRIVAVTPGVLLRMLQDDPFLEGTGCVIFDEFHERGLESDLALGLVRHLQQQVRAELRVVVMSATLGVEEVSKYLGGCPIIESEGRSYPVEIVYEPKKEPLRWPEAMARTIERWLDRTDGDLLVFLPGLGEIRGTARELEHAAREHDLAVVSLYGDLPAEDQDAALQPQSRRKVVLATNVAETSVTVDGITAVIDTGLARVMTYDPAVGLDRLELTPISRASADQRAGRAGRTRPGMCVRMWTELNHRARAAHTDPEIRRVDLAGAVLQLLSLGENDILAFPWLEPPKEVAVEQALLLLRRLGALGDTGLTDLGKLLPRLPVHPRLGRLLVEGQRLGCGERAALAAAMLAERDPFIRPAMPKRRDSFSDVADRIVALEQFEQSGQSASLFGEVNRGAAHFLFRARDQLLQSIQQEMPASSSEFESDWVRCLLPAFPDRLARRRNPRSERGVMVGGRGVKVAPGSGVVEPELFLCLDVDAGEIESLVRIASGVRREWLPPELVSTTTEVQFEESTERVTARKRVRFMDLILEESTAALPEGEATASVLRKAASENLERVLPAADSPMRNFLIRIRCLNQWAPELGLPAFDDAFLREVLADLCSSCRSFADLRNADWLGSLRGRLSYTQLQTIEREAPERIEVPSGSHIALKYEAGRPPVLAVRIQELFGLTDTPRIAGGKASVLLHLLAPNYRPQQVTDDLASFWANTYPQVRKELRARYPKHAWPENPLAAEPESRPNRNRARN